VSISLCGRSATRARRRVPRGAAAGSRAPDLARDARVELEREPLSVVAHEAARSPRGPRRLTGELPSAALGEPPEADDGLGGETAPHLADEGCDGVATVERVLVLGLSRAAASLGWQRFRGRARAVAEDLEAEVGLGRSERLRCAAADLSLSLSLSLLNLRRPNTAA
jgi:hypothetical protein